ncbi:MAG: sodium:solute symporter [Bacteroidetes bacterium RIFCSPLOWO2_02_FULL_36_8]|nr:MAG: sodium:solute symporter [Bacteroidetes bacterium RIFCSPLOWO2_02_FULL_36_8]OFY70861.1 MAG: sodium:solute symporter [Bacteroidetes bacterium RIFCSPLOWO2_12_FULL_37_12]
MSGIDWSILISSLVFISVYGIYKSRGTQNTERYLRGDNTLPWYAVGLSVMATQASAITFLSGPGQAYTDGMRFVQFYFGLPLAMILICIFVVPVYHRLKIYTAYQFLETRFDLKTRSLAALLFLIQRGIASGLTIYAPAIILSTLLGWNIYLTNIVIGGIVIIYTVTGGTKAVSYTQLPQMAIILVGMFVAGFLLIYYLPDNVGFTEAIRIAGKMGKMNIIDVSHNFSNQYTIWSGLIGGMFLALSYFGTDQSQVSRYLSAKSVTENKIGLLFNGLVKIPMQFSILLIGAILFVFYLFVPVPLLFNKVELEKVKQSVYSDEFKKVETDFNDCQRQINTIAVSTANSLRNKDDNSFVSNVEQLKIECEKRKSLKEEGIAIMKKNSATSATSDVNYIFLSYVLEYLPVGVVGLLIALVFAASMSSTSSELNALASTTLIDIYKRNFRTNKTDAHYLSASKWFTAGWGIYAILVAQLSTNLGSLIEAVNKLGSYFYGTILGIFILAFLFKRIKGSTAFYSALIAEIGVILCAVFTPVSFLWYNVIGAILVVIVAHLIQLSISSSPPSPASNQPQLFPLPL